jgi:hypothetical protein
MDFQPVPFSNAMDLGPRSQTLIRAPDARHAYSSEWHGNTGSTVTPATWSGRHSSSNTGIGPSGLDRRRGLVEEAIDDYQEKPYDSEGEGDSSSYISTKSTMSTMTSFVSSTFRDVGRAVRKRFGRKHRRKARAELRALENNADMRMLEFYRPMFPHHRPDPRLNKVYLDLCRLSGLAINTSSRISC